MKARPDRGGRPRRGSSLGPRKPPWVVRAGQHPGGSGDRLTAKMGISASRVRGSRPGFGSRAPSVELAQGPAAGARRIMRQVAGDTDPGWLLSGMSLGMDEGLSPPAQQDMRDSGLSHLTAVSGRTALCCCCSFTGCAAGCVFRASRG